MFSLLAPHLHCDNVLQISAHYLRSLDRVGLLLDVDCTLKDYGDATIPEPVQEWLRSLRNAGISLCLLSNGKAKRIAPLAESLGIPFIAKAFKPLPIGCRAALRLIGLPAHRTAIVGDQLFADIMAGKLAGLFTILVRPTTEVEPIWTRVKRPFERFVLRRIHSNGAGVPMKLQPSNVSVATSSVVSGDAIN